MKLIPHSLIRPRTILHLAVVCRYGPQVDKELYSLRAGLMQTATELVVFRLADQRYALPLERVERIVRAAHVARLPNAPANVLGVIDIEGNIVPVLNIRRQFQQQSRPISALDQFLIARTSKRSVILVIDEAVGVIQTSLQSAAVPDTDQIAGAITLDDGLLLIQDLEKFLSPEDEATLEKAISEGGFNAE